uniref:Uncharacterized protein n=1 Tax=Utricularia reniformis TaxID=192314 RepID=A0A1Y0B2Q9_9LAMI|nr:hypothetical protein AEK19_MT1487 [Utricularia reniformis]ART31678.1 hypothetical protein AEK19_MT1487 [Utricularia reniformis]
MKLLFSTRFTAIQLRIDETKGRMDVVQLPLQVLLLTRPLFFFLCSPRNHKEAGITQKESGSKPLS